MADASSELDWLEVGVAVVPAGESPERPSDRDGGRGGVLSGYEEAAGLGRVGRRAAERVVVKGGEAVRAATEAVAEQIGLTSQRIASAIETRGVAPAGPGELGLESVEVSFGITLAGGVQTLFTAQADSSVLVTVTLTRRPTEHG